MRQGHLTCHQQASQVKTASYLNVKQRPVGCPTSQPCLSWAQGALRVAQAMQVRVWPGQDAWRQDLCTAAAACLQHMCQHTDARPAVQAAGAIPVLAHLCDLDQWSLKVVRYASAALASIAVGPAVKVCWVTWLSYQR